MNSRGIIICDKDKDYCMALTSFLMAKTLEDKGMMITGISETERITGVKGDYEIGLVSEDFLDALGENPKIRIEQLMILREKKEDCLESDFFKYQNMSSVIASLNRKIPVKLDVNKEAKDSVKMIGLYSPAKHELTLPYALCVCKSLGEKSETLFVDLSEIGILPKITGRVYEEDLIDLIYTLENGGLSDGITSYIKEYEGIYLLSPVSSPSQFSYISPAQWKSLFGKIKESGFRNIVVLFGNLIQGFSEMARDFSKIYIIKKPGDYYAVAESVFSDFMEALGMSEICEEVILPLSVSSGSKGGFRLGGLLAGKLREFADSKMEESFG